MPTGGMRGVSTPCRRASAERLWVVPREAEAPGALVLRLDPGMAFGTGSHPTTRLCLEWLARQQLDGLRVLDLGCGSGILGLAALKLGCASVHAIDHDPQALLATRDNAAYNAIADDRLIAGEPALLEDVQNPSIWWLPTFSPTR